MSTISCAHPAGGAEYVWVEGSHAPLQSGEHHFLGCFGCAGDEGDGSELGELLGLGNGLLTEMRPQLGWRVRASSMLNHPPPAVVLRPLFLALVSSWRVKSWSVASATFRASLRCSRSCCWRWLVWGGSWALEPRAVKVSMRLSAFWCGCGWAGWKWHIIPITWPLWPAETPAAMHRLILSVFSRIFPCEDLLHDISWHNIFKNS